MNDRTRNSSKTKSRGDRRRSTQKSLSSGSGSGNKHKSRKSGLSPPKDKPSDSKMDDLVTDADVDRTQWNNTRFHDEAKGLVTIDPDEVMRNKIGEATPLLMESKQVMLSRGEHLKNKPVTTLIMMSIECVLILVVMCVWASFVSNNETVPIIFCFSNLLISLLSIALIFSIELCRFQVKKEKLDEDYRFRVPYEWKYWLCMGHVLRFLLTCANITIAALDEDFDGGAITVISVQPVVLILCMSHVFFALRPQG